MAGNRKVPLFLFCLISHLGVFCPVLFADLGDGLFLLPELSDPSSVTAAASGGGTDDPLLEGMTLSSDANANVVSINNGFFEASDLPANRPTPPPANQGE